MRTWVRHFTDATAFAPESAIPFTPGLRLDCRWFERLQRSGVVRSAAPGLYYLDQDALAHERARMRRTIAVVLAMLAIVLGTFVALGMLR